MVWAALGAAAAGSGMQTASSGMMGAAKMKAGYKYARKLAIHRYPWMVQSLQRAGLNPLLAVGGAQPGPMSIQQTSGDAGPSPNFLEAIRTGAQVDALKAQAEQHRAGARHQDSLRGLVDVQKSGAEADLPEKQFWGNLYKLANTVGAGVAEEYNRSTRPSKGVLEQPEVKALLEMFHRALNQAGSNAKQSGLDLLSPWVREQVENWLSESDKNDVVPRRNKGGN